MCLLLLHRTCWMFLLLSFVVCVTTFSWWLSCVWLGTRSRSLVSAGSCSPSCQVRSMRWISNEQVNEQAQERVMGGGVWKKSLLFFLLHIFLFCLSFSGVASFDANIFPVQNSLVIVVSSFIFFWTVYYPYSKIVWPKGTGRSGRLPLFCVFILFLSSLFDCLQSVRPISLSLVLLFSEVSFTLPPLLTLPFPSSLLATQCKFWLSLRNGSFATWAPTSFLFSNMMPFQCLLSLFPSLSSRCFSISCFCFSNQCQLRLSLRNRCFATRTPASSLQ